MIKKIKEQYDIKEAIRLDKFENFDVVCDTDNLLQVRCGEGRFVAEALINGRPISLIQGNNIMIWHKISQIYIGNDYIVDDNDGIEVKVYYEDLSNLFR